MSDNSEVVENEVVPQIPEETTPNNAKDEEEKVDDRVLPSLHVDIEADPLDVEPDVLLPFLKDY